MSQDYSNCIKEGKIENSNVFYIDSKNPYAFWKIYSLNLLDSYCTCKKIANIYK